MITKVIGVDLAEKVIQACTFIDGKMIANQEMTPAQFKCFLASQSPSVVVFEACSSAHYWHQQARYHGHKAKLISSYLVSVVRQNQKTDRNDALAIVQAASLPDINFISGKTDVQQQLQSMMRLRALAVKQRTATKNQLLGLLKEFNLQVTGSGSKLLASTALVLEDASNGLSEPFRKALHTAREMYSVQCLAVEEYDYCLEYTVKELPDCRKLLKLEGVVILNAINLYIALGCGELGAFKRGKDAAACIGLTPVQYSSGGKTRMGTISHRAKNSGLRSLLITGVMAVVHQLCRRSPLTQKEQWLMSLIERRGKKCAAVALANKTVRTAFAMLTQHTEYRAIDIE